MVIAIHTLVLRLRRSTAVPQHVPQAHHVDEFEAELPLVRSSVLATIAAADSASVLTTSDHAIIMRTGAELSTSEQP